MVTIGALFPASGFVVRVDTGFSEEGAQVQMIISQPFQIL
jgi:hypothetical protein